MSYYQRFLILSLLTFFVISTKSHAAYTSQWIDSPAEATFERTAAYQRTFVDLPKYGGHVQYTLPTQAVRSGMGGAYVSPASTATIPKVASSISIALAKGAATVATLTAVIPKVQLAKAATMLVRANPYIATALTLGWLANAGYQYFKVTDTFTQSLPTTTLSCPSVPSYNPITHTQFKLCTYVNSDWDCASLTGWAGVCANYGGNPLTGMGVISRVLTAPPPISVTAQQVQDGLGTKPIASGGDTAAGFDGILKEQMQNGIYPDTDGLAPLLTGPASVQGGLTTTTSPNADVTNETTVHNMTYNTNYVDMNTTITTVVTHPSGSTDTTVKTGPTETTPQPESKTDCDKFPDNIGCSKYGTIPTAEIIPTVNIPVSVAYTAWGEGSCPASVQMKYGVTFDYSPFCGWLVQARPVIIGSALLMAALLIVSGVKD